MIEHWWHPRSCLEPLIGILGSLAGWIAWRVFAGGEKIAQAPEPDEPSVHP